MSEFRNSQSHTFESIIKSQTGGNLASVLKFVKSTVTDPALYCSKWYIPLVVESYQQHAEAQVSQSLILSAGDSSKSYITDNVAPSSWSWNISGYIKASSSLEVSSRFTPFTTLQKNQLRTAFSKGSRLNFKDIDCRIYKNVVIQSIDLMKDSEADNAIPFSMQLKQINTIDSSLIDLVTSEQLAQLESGSELGASTSLASTSCQTASSSWYEKLSSATLSFLGLK